MSGDRQESRQSAFDDLAGNLCQRLETEWHDDATGWLELLSAGHRAKILDETKNGQTEKTGSSTRLCSLKYQIRPRSYARSGWSPAVGHNCNVISQKIRKLRDYIAHVNYYAETPEAARQVCQVVGKIRQIREELLTGIEER